jgi:signal transduction histidine kinase
MVYAARTQKYVRCYYVTIFTVFLFLFPYIFFTTGGYSGGMAFFFVFAVVFTAFMLERKPAYLMLVLELAVYIGCYAAAFLRPEAVSGMPDGRGHFLHNLVDFMIVAVSLAGIALAHFGLYNRQQKRLDEQNAVLEQANRMKTEFLANASHEMRTPLTVTSVNVQTAMEILEDTGERTDESEAIELLQNAQSEIMRLSRMVGGMLTLASMSENTERQKLDLSTLLRSSVETLRLSLSRRGNVLKTEIEPKLVVFGNADLLAQTLTNILQNAENHTENGAVTVWAGRQGNEIAVRVSDTGAGVPTELLPRVFERGVTDGGTGYGLYLCKTVVESHGGRIWIESEPGVGTTVSYRLPVYQGQHGWKKP